MASIKAETHPSVQMRAKAALDMPPAPAPSIPAAPAQSTMSGGNTLGSVKGSHSGGVMALSVSLTTLNLSKRSDCMGRKHGHQRTLSETFDEGRPQTRIRKHSCACCNVSICNQAACMHARTSVVVVKDGLALTSTSHGLSPASMMMS